MRKISYILTFLAGAGALAFGSMAVARYAYSVGIEVKR